MAQEALSKGDDVNFFKFINQKALASDDTLVPASLALAKYYLTNDNQYRQAIKVLTASWVKNPTYEVAIAYLNIFAKDDVTSRIQRMEAFALKNGLRPSLNNIILAELATEAGLWGKAQSEIEIFLINNPATKKLSRMIYEYEKYANNDLHAAQRNGELELLC